MKSENPEKAFKMYSCKKYFEICIETLRRYQILFGIELILSSVAGIVLVFPVLGIILALNELLRFCVKVSLWLVYDDKYELSSDGVGSNYTLLNAADRHTILYVGELESPITIESVKENLQTRVIENPAYSNLLTRVCVEKWFYMCLKKCDNFDINNHVRIYPGTENRTVSENELLRDILPALRPDMKDLNKPQWELVIIPNYAGEKALKIIRIHHSYMDGASTLIMIANTFTSEGDSFPFVINPCKALKISKISMFLYKLTSLALFSSSVLSNLLNPPSSKTSRFAITDPKTAGKTLFGWTSKIPIEQFQKIKEKSGVSMAAIVTSVMAAAIGSLEVKHANKNQKARIQKHQPLWLVAGMFPYPQKPCNNHLALETTIDVSDKAVIERLTLMNDCLGRLGKNPQVQVYFWETRLIGRAPTLISRLFLKLTCSPIVLSNIPLCTRNIRMWDKECHGITGWVPLICKTGLGVVSVRYANHFRYCVQVDSSVINQDELDFFTSELEHQVELLSWETSKLERRISTDVSLFAREKEMKKSDLLSASAIIKEDDAIIITNRNGQTNNNVCKNKTNLDVVGNEVSVMPVCNNNRVDEVDNDEVVSNNEEFSSKFILKLKDSIDQIKHGIKKIKDQ